MKAERRHQLKTNTLATKLVKIPESGWKPEGRTILVAVAVVLLGVLVYVRYNNAQSDKQRWADQLGIASEQALELRLAMVPATTVRDRAAEITTNLNDIIEHASNPQIKANALATKGDVALSLANAYARQPTSADGSPATAPSAGPLASTAPTTEPSLLGGPDSLANAPLSPEPAYDDASDAYNNVLTNYPQQTQAVLRARFGLAAIAEDHAKWDDAASQYDAIIKNTDLPAGAIAYAKQRRDGLAALREPVYLAPATQPVEPPPFPATTRTLKPLGSTSMPSHGSPASTRPAPLGMPTTTIAPPLPDTRPTTQPALPAGH